MLILNQVLGPSSLRLFAQSREGHRDGSVHYQLDRMTWEIGPWVCLLEEMLLITY